MPDPLPIAEIRRRAQALRIPPKLFAALAGVDRGTIYRAMEERCRMKPRRLQKLSDALIAKERAELARLLALHPPAKV